MIDVTRSVQRCAEQAANQPEDKRWDSRYNSDRTQHALVSDAREKTRRQTAQPVVRVVPYGVGWAAITQRKEANMNALAFLIFLFGLVVSLVGNNIFAVAG